MSGVGIVEEKILEEFTVFVRATLDKDSSPEDAEIDPGILKDHRFQGVSARCKDEAANKGLDQFHETVPIGVLDYVGTETFVFAKNDVGMPDDMWVVGDILTCTCCGKGLRHTPEENCAFGQSPYPYDNGFGECRACGGDPKGKTIDERMGWATISFAEARFDILRKGLNPVAQKKWDEQSRERKLVIVLQFVEKGYIV